MSIPAAFIGVVLIWSTTPLAIQWSSAGGGFLFGVAARMLLGLAGLVLIFGQGLRDQHIAVKGMLGVLLSVVIHSLSSVWVKRIGAAVPAVAVTGGGLLVAATLYLAAWLALGEPLPRQLPAHAGLAILYLSLMGSVVGFMLFYYVLRHVAASRIALITLVTPVIALWLGRLFNHEAVAPRVWLGTALILGGLIAHQWGDRLRLREPALPVPRNDAERNPGYAE